ncbi:hypothetical protein CBS101457_005869 [Exobasidium rhododendri]|nr:hypothetical protein CBS101457_005869 [Exobasidium rhododendri]
MKLLVVGGNGFLGSAIVKQALSRQWEVVSISQSGKPFVTPAGHRPAWSSSSHLTWKAADALQPGTYEEVVKSCDAVVHTIGILLESDYKGKTSGGSTQIWQGLKKGWGIGSDSASNPLKDDMGAESSSSSSPPPSATTYEKMNRDTALTVARTFSSTRTLGDLSPFVYISAEDIFRPIISSRYIETKRQAEAGITSIAQSSPDSIRPVFLRPGLMYHPQTRPLSTFPAAAFDLSTWIHSTIAKAGIPLPTPAWLLSKFPAADLSALSRLLTTSPLHVDTVAKAACEAIVNKSIQGPFGVEDIQRLARFKSQVGTASQRAPSVGLWPSQQITASSSATLGRRTFSTTVSHRRHAGQESRDSSSSSSSSTSTKVSLPVVAVAVTIAYLLQHINKPYVENEVASLTQQELMKARSISQGVYAWGSNRYNVVAPDAPLTTFVKTPRSIPYFDGIALRDLSMEERHGAAVDANGDVLQWGLGFFDASLENVNKQENLDDVPLGRRREKEKANELTPRGSLGAQALGPVKTLVGKDIVKLATSDTKIFALSKSGKVYVFSSVRERQLPGRSGDWSWNPLRLFGLFASSTIDFEELRPISSAKLTRGEHISDIKAGSHHLLALSSKGRTFSTPIDTDGNAYGQLGTRRIVLGTKKELVEIIMDARMLTEVEVRPAFHQTQVLPAWALPPGFESSSKTDKPVTGPENRGIYVRSRLNADDSSVEKYEVIAPAANIRYCTTLHEIPTLKGLQVDQIATGSDHSIARTSAGKVLGWGRQTHGQTGLGTQIALEAVPVPTEIVLARSFANTSVDIHCTDIAAGADNTFFTMSRREPGGIGNGIKIDVLAVGKGQWGSLGNAMWSQVTLSPVKVKTVSGLIEYSETTGTTHPVPIHSISIGKPGSIALTLDTVEAEGHQAFGRDVMVFGHNAAYQLGTSKRSNLCIPQHLQPLPAPTPFEGAAAPALLMEASKLKEADVNSGVLTHMPHKRLQLVSQTKADTHTASSSAGGKGNVKRNVEMEESIVAGAVSMAVFWRIHV